MFRCLAGVACAAALPACASLEPEPCTADWVEWKTEQTLQPFADEYRPLINDLRGFSRQMEDPGPLTMLRLATKLDEFRALAADFQGEVMPELRAAVDQCGTPAKFAPAFTSFLRKEGVEEEMLVWVEALGTLAAEREAS